MTAGMIKVPSIMPLRIPGGTRKNMIDTNTLIELRTETLDTIIYYTINGAKPEPFKVIGEKCTYRYNKPFVLAPGKRPVKAMATSRDGTRESSVVTKTFLVEEASLEDVIENGSEMMQSFNSSSGNLRQKSSRGLISHILDNAETHKVKRQQEMQREAWSMSVDNSSNYRQTSTPLGLDDCLKGSEHRKAHTEPRFMSARFGSSKQALVNSTGRGESQAEGEIRRIPENKVQVNRTQQETNFLKCIYCYAARPSDPFARFCHDCGSPLPPLPSSRLPPPEGGQLGMCVSCHSMVPLNTATCIVCEAPLSPQRLPQASKKLQTKLVCPGCGTANPPDLRICVTCESVLPRNAKQIFSGESAPPLPSAQIGDYVTCSKCSRINSADARFCDWCGAKPLPYRKHVICSKCEAANNPYASYCNSCGCNMEPPPRQSHRSSGGVIGTLVEKGNVQAIMGNSKNPTWLPVSVPSSPPETDERGTQTVGLFYPSSQTLQAHLDSEAAERARFESVRDRRPALAAVSPGRGYWRQQMDHVCSHLRAHAQNNPEFRNIIGEPRLGKIISATTCEDLNGEEFTITVTYARRDGQESFKQKTNAIANGIKAFNISSVGSREDLSSSWQSTGRTKKAKKSLKKKSTKDLKKVATPKEEKLLLAELGAKGQGRIEEVERLLDDGARPDCETADGILAVAVAVQNNHFDCLPILQSSGADLNARSATKGNTALHEAVLLGPNGLKCVDMLLNLGADSNAKNDAGQTPYDLAVSSGHDAIAQKFTSSLGNEMLQKLTKPLKMKHSIE